MRECCGSPNRPAISIIKNSEPSQICPPLCFACPLTCSRPALGPKPIKTEVYLRPHPLCPPYYPMPCPPKVQVISMPMKPPPPPPPAQPRYCVTIKRIPVRPPPPPTPPVFSPCRAICMPCPPPCLPSSCS
ncbi:late cornified envelope-like proline-rich protein 1 [Diachasma alloeum]|uniref:late cornified envelope-like proline-rich protein 1 n=1 Tax=Diachasma alloeum TaxID=454923 RepID=UPI0007384B6B|nr:late cornified envelope-like proline-rich protein 1 [Diachasma alloeum]